MGPMKKMRLSLACALLAALTALSACGSPRNTPAGNGGNSAADVPSVEAAAARTITVSLSAAQATLDPASATAPAAAHRAAQGSARSRSRGSRAWTKPDRSGSLSPSTESSVTPMI